MRSQLIARYPLKGTSMKVLSYIKKHPDATYRDIQKGCKLASTSVVNHHIARLIAAQKLIQQPRWRVL
jgi:hypothetical protein